MPTHSAHSPPGSRQGETKPERPIQPLPTLDAEAFRRKLAGLIDPDAPQGVSEKEAVKQDAIRFCSILAHLFGDSLERTTLWERIGSALSTALAKSSDGDLDLFATLCLEHVCAADAQVAACEPLLQLLTSWEPRPVEWRQALQRYLQTHRTAALVHARARWERVKRRECEL